MGGYLRVVVDVDWDRLFSLRIYEGGELERPYEVCGVYGLFIGIIGIGLQMVSAHLMHIRRSSWLMSFLDKNAA